MNPPILDDTTQIRFSAKIEINASSEKVFSWINDPNHAMKWMTSVTKTQIIKESPDKVGTTFREIIEDKRGQLEMFGTITEYKHNEKISFQLNSKVNTVYDWYFLEEIEGSTHLSLTAEIQFKSSLRFLIYIIWPVFKKKLTDQTQKELMNLKRLCEQKD
ncbi:MAG: SRPBCC family protein [Candidatus Aminicenantes bacterium]|nr:SRPBCC family protein [Candidatus Aminicenantes bacterium]